MACDFDRLCNMLNLTQYQADTLRAGIDANTYDVSRILKRNGILYVPWHNKNVFERLACVFVGRRADAIGQTKMCARCRRMKL